MTMHHPQLAQAQAEAFRGWTETRISVAKALYNGGLTAAQVACLIGGVTRNAVIGKINRDGLGDAARKKSRAAGEARSERRKRSGGSVHTRVQSAITRRTLANEEAAPPPIVDAQIPLEQRRTLAQLDDACCHWPVGDPRSSDFFFCGAPSQGSAPYCSSHLHRSLDQTRRGANSSALLFARSFDRGWRQ